MIILGLFKGHCAYDRTHLWLLLFTSAPAGYLAHGTATDYMHDILGVPFSFTWEIYGDIAASFHDCFRMFNPLTKEHLEEVHLASLWPEEHLDLAAHK